MLASGRICMAQRILALTLIASFVTSSSTTSLSHAGDAMRVEMLPQAPTTEPRRDLGHIFGDLQQRFSVTIKEHVWFLNEQEIDDAVGDPCLLQPATAAKLRFMEPRMRLEFYNVMFDRINRVTVIDTVASRAEPGMISGGPRFYVGLDPNSGKMLLDHLQGTIFSSFTDREFADLGVYILCKNNTLHQYFSKTENWHKFRDTLLNWDLVIGAAVIATLVLTRQAPIGASGYIVKLLDDRLRLGWYGNLSNLGYAFGKGSQGGFTLSSIQAGLQVTGMGLDAKGGYYQKFHANPDEIQQAIEFSLKEHWLQGIATKLGFGWEIAASANGRYILGYGNSRYDGTWNFGGDVFARKERFAENDSLTFVTSMSGSSNLRGAYSAATTIGLQSRYMDVGGYLRLADNRDPIARTSDRSIKFLLEFASDSQTRINRGFMDLIADAIVRQLTYLAARTTELAALEPELAEFGTGKRSEHEERELIRRLKRQERWVSEGEQELLRLMARYIDTRSEYYTVTMRVPANDLLKIITIKDDLKHVYSRHTIGPLGELFCRQKLGGGALDNEQTCDEKACWALYDLIAENGSMCDYCKPLLLKVPGNKDNEPSDDQEAIAMKNAIKNTMKNAPKENGCSFLKSRWWQDLRQQNR